MVGIGWTVIVVGLIIGGAFQIHRMTMDSARSDARAHFLKDQAFRLWGTSHGGVYAPVDDRTLPNPNLSHIPERDIETPSGTKLTLLNPAYMVRQMNENFSEMYGVAGRITSRAPFSAANAPDEWELNALNAFEGGMEEVTELIDIEGEPQLRLMRPIITKEGCLKCHAVQGYKVGSVDGAVGI
jgi:hypothetical protein